MVDRLTKCTACNGRGYHRCDCWPADCICGQHEDTCFECDGEGIIDNFYADDFDCDCSNYETDLLEGSARCHRCGRSWALSQEDITAEIEHQAAYMAYELATTAGRDALEKGRGHGS